MKRSSTKTPRVLFFVVIGMLCVVLITANLTGGLFAKFIFGDKSDDNAQVAKFNVQHLLERSKEGEPAESVSFSTGSSMRPGDVMTYTVEVNNPGEVAVTYNLQMLSRGNLPLYTTTPQPGELVALTVDAAPVLLKTVPPNTTQTFNFQVSWPSEQKDISFGGKVDAITFILTLNQAD